MSCAIPRDLDSQWFLSDVVLLAENAEGRELHVSRALLSSASPVFQAMFSSSFEESSQDRISICCDYEALREVLRFIHHASCNCPKKILSAEFLFSMYVVADMWDYLIVRKSLLKTAEGFNNGLYEYIQETFGIQEKNVSCSIPQDFDAPWFASDAEVVSREGDRFYVSEALLTIGSSFFRDQFIFLKSSSIEVPIPSDLLMEILHRMHHIYCECSHEVVHPDTLLHLHLAANLLNAPKIKETSLPQLDLLPRALQQATERFIQGERASLASFCQNLRTRELLSFLSADDTRPLFSKEDLTILCDIPRNTSLKYPKVVHLEEESTKNNIIPFNLNYACNLYDVKIVTKKSPEMFLYSRKDMLAKFSNFFAKKFEENDWSEGKSPEGYDVITVDEEYPTMRRILGALMGAHKAIYSLSAPFIYDIYQAASEDRLDIQKIRDICRKDIITSPGWLRCEESSYLELAIRLKFDEQISILLERMRKEGKGDELREWVEGSRQPCSYYKDGEAIVIEVKSDEHVFSCKHARIVCEHLLK